jgi:hypothetical protein
VLDRLAVAARLCALVFDTIDAIDAIGAIDAIDRNGPAWSRRLVYNWPEPATFDLAWLGRHIVHEVEHPLDDVTSILHETG